jgi:hypothetical protein
VQKKFLGIVVTLLVMATAVSAENLPVQYLTPFFTEFFDSTTTYNGNPVIVGSIIEAYDPTNLVIGRWRVTSAGRYGFMNAYGDEPGTPGTHEGALAGDSIKFRINGRNATVVAGDPTFTNQAIKQVQLAASAGSVALSLVEAPIDILGLPGDTLQFAVKVRNDGDGLDFYGVHLNMSIPESDPFGWKAFEPDSVVYANPAQEAYVYFSIRVATFSPDTVNNIIWTVYSNVDTTQKVSGNFNIYMTLTDVDDPDNGLPNSFAVYQNYPNPFNPTTTIRFYLPRTQSTSLQVFNVLGQLISVNDYGSLSAGEHEVLYDASRISSGVYFYRVITEDGAKVRKMVLLK